MPRRKIRDHDDARACLEAAAASGLTRAVWAHAHGVDARSLNAWRITLERPVRPSEARTAPARLVELVATETTPSATYVVRCGGMAVEVDDRFDDNVLRRLLAVVASC